MSLLWLIIPVLVASPIFVVTMVVSIIASHVQLKPHQLATSETERVDID
jgi:hypothetical protein